MNVTFYSFSKRKNSTKQPTAAGTDKDCKLKDNCSVHNPVLILANNPIQYNYAYISTWGKYYFVTDIISLANGLSEYHLKEDVLASNKIAIGSTKAMIEYSSSDYNIMIVDPRLSVAIDKDVHTQNGSHITGNSSRFLLFVFNTDASYVYGMSTVYSLSDMALASFKLAMNNTTLVDNISQYFNGTFLDGIFAMKQVPWVPTHETVTHEIKIGNQTISVTDAATTIGYYKIITDVFNIGVLHNDFRQTDPYSRGRLFLPSIGNIDINLSDFLGSDKMYVETVINEVTGDIAYAVKDQSGNIHFTASINVAIDLPIGQTVLNSSGTINSIGGVAAGIAGTAVGAIVGGPAGAAAGITATMASAISLGMSSNQKTPSIHGGIGSSNMALEAHDQIKYTEYSLKTVDPLNADYVALQGRPLGEPRTINTLSGYIQCVNAHVALNATEEELTEIEAYLNSGFYYE